ncbi:MAG: dehydrogenase [Frankiales bacterium]|nr:dehydrogenase [Frankiales bacterium]
MLPDLTGAVALVTGGASGIGAAAVRQLSAGGARVVIADLDLAAAEALAAEVGGTAVRCDVRDPLDSERAVALAEQAYGGLDVALLNAGVAGGFASWDDLDLDRYRTMVGVNVDGVVFGVRAALPALRRRGGGALVATASLAGLAPASATPVYALTKGAVVQFVRSMAPPLAVEGIRLTALCPGFVETPLLSGMVERFHESGFPLLTADDVAAAAVELARSGEPGACVICQPGREPTAYAFRGVPGPRGLGEGVRPPTRTPVPGTGPATVVRD